MADIRTLTMEGTTYNIKDATARGDITTLQTNVTQLQTNTDDLPQIRENVENNTDDIRDLKSAMDNTVVPSIAMHEKTYLDGETYVKFVWLNKTTTIYGKPGADSNIRLISAPVIVPQNASCFCVRKLPLTEVTFRTFDADDNLITTLSPTDINEHEIDISDATYIRCSAYYTDNRQVSPSDGDSLASAQLMFVANDVSNSYITKYSKNIINTGKSTIGEYIASDRGVMSSSSTYDTTDYLSASNSIVFNKRIRKLLAYDKYKKPVQSSYLTNEQTAGYVYTPGTGEVYVRVSYYHADRNEMQAEYGTTPTYYTPYREKVEENVHLSDTMHADIYNIMVGNVLYGKKWVACGDSFTQGDFSNAPVDNYHITEGKYAGQLAVYPYLIGNRNNMTIVNEAISGSTMTHIDGRDTAFSDTRYQNIAADADYITLKFGINDDSRHQDVPIGTIDDATNDTFYGAWNVVMNYLITHHLDAKIGIIITNGATVEIADATIAIAKKWGVPYLNEATGEQCSYVFRSNRTNISQAIRNAKNENWYVHATEPINSHPNAAAHRFESTVVEEWLRSL